MAIADLARFCKEGMGFWFEGGFGLWFKQE